MRRNISCSERGVKFNSIFGLKTCICREASLVDDFYTEKLEINNKEVVFYRDPMYVLFNQKRLNQLSTEQIRDWLQSMTNHGDSSLAQIKAKCSDDELIQMVRSRSLQTPSEITLWCREMQRNQDNFKAQLLDAQKAIEESKKQQSIVEPSKTE